VSRASEYVSYGLIAAALGLTVVAVVDRDRPTTKEQSARAGMLLRVFRPDEITRITLERRNERVELVREGDNWKLTSPRIAKADFIAVTGFLNAMQGARSERALGQVQGSERAQLGLDAPRVRAEIAMKGVTLKLALGGPASGAQAEDSGALASYVEVSPYGDEKGGVFVVPADVAAALDRGSDAFRESSLLGVQSPQFTKIDVANKVSLTRAPNGSWRLPNGVRASADTVDGLLIALYELKAGPFLPDNTPVDVAKGGAVEITLLDNQKLNVSFGGACPNDGKQVVARAGQTTGCVPETVTARIAMPESAYPDNRAFWLLPGGETQKISEIEAIVVESGGAKVIDAERRGDGLHLRIPNDEQIDNASTERFLGRVAAITGTIVEKPDLAALGLSPPAGRATIRRRLGAAMAGAADGGAQISEQVVEVSAATKDAVYIRRVDDGVVLRVPLELAQPLRAAAAHELRSPNLLALTADSVRRIHVRPTDGIAFEISRKTGVWELTTPAGFGADAASAGTITSTLATMLCLRWASDKDDGSFGFDKPSVVIDVEREAKDPEPGTISIELGKEVADANGGVYARVKGRDPVCVLPIGKRDALLRPPVDYRNVSFDPTQTPRIEVTRGTRHRLLQYSDVTKAWNDASDAGGDYIARKLADAIRGLRAEGLVHLGPSRADEGFDVPFMVLTGSDGAAVKKRLLVGGVGKLNDVPVYYVRIDGTEATWAVLRADIEAITSLL
jgi:hypothetical protein